MADQESCVFKKCSALSLFLGFAFVTACLDNTVSEIRADKHRSNFFTARRETVRKFFLQIA
jgi:hypothetical protein